MMRSPILLLAVSVLSLAMSGAPRAQAPAPTGGAAPPAAGAPPGAPQPEASRGGPAVRAHVCAARRERRRPELVGRAGRSRRPVRGQPERRHRIRWRELAPHRNDQPENHHPLAGHRCERRDLRGPGARLRLPCARTRPANCSTSRWATRCPRTRRVQRRVAHLRHPVQGCCSRRAVRSSAGRRRDHGSGRPRASSTGPHWSTSSSTSASPKPA